MLSVCYGAITCITYRFLRLLGPHRVFCWFQKCVCVCQECAKRIAKVSSEAKLDVDEETYLNAFRPHLMDVVYTWANGSTFAQICKMTDVFEGEPSARHPFRSTASDI